MNKKTIIAGLLSVGLLMADETKWVSVGQLHDWFSSGGCEIEVGRRHLIPDQQDGLQWPAQYGEQDVKAAKALWIGAANYTDPGTGQNFPSRVVHAGPRVLNELAEFMPTTFKLIARYEHPQVFVDGSPASDLIYEDLVDEVNENIPSDRLLVNVCNTSLGITMTRKIYIYSHPKHDNYYIYVYSFKNTGIYNLAGDRHTNTLEDVHFFWQERYAMTKEACSYGYNWMPQNATWGRNTMNEVIGENGNYGPTVADNPYRASYAWHGIHSGWAGVAGENLGAPNIGGGDIAADGRLGASQFTGVMTIHADLSGTDKNNDPNQPTSTPFPDSDGPYNSGNDHNNTAKMSVEYALMTSGHPALSHAEEVGSGAANDFGPTGGGYSIGRGYGPYTIASGDSIVIVTVEAVAGLARDKQFSIEADWLSGVISNAEKDAHVFSGKDSLFLAFQRALDTYNNSFDIAHEPPPPDNFTVNSGGDRIICEWSNSAESWDTFAGYRLYRASMVYDTTYTLIAELGPGETYYEDRTPTRGFDYFYYVTTIDNGSTNNGVPLESSLFYTRTNKAAYLRRPPEAVLDRIRIVPNPYNVKARNFMGQPLQFGSGAGADRLMFYNLPPFCIIRIYTERGDLVETIDHSDGSGDEEWRSLTSSKQVIVSGLYIAHFEVTQDYEDEVTLRRVYKGDTAIKKFIIIR